VLGFLDRLTAGQRQVLAGLSSLVVLLGLAVGAVAMSAEEPASQAVETQADDGAAAPPGDGRTSTSSSSTTSTTSEPRQPGEDAADVARRPPTGVERATPSRGTLADPDRASTTTRARVAAGRTGGTGGGPPGGGTSGGGGAGTSSSAARSSSTTTARASGCTTAGTGGAAGDLATRYCRHRAGSGATASMARSDRLDEAARDWARELAVRGGVPHGPYAAAVADVCPSCTAGENVAMQSPGSTAKAWEQWLGSPPHRANLDDRRGGFYGTGTAVAADGETTYYVHIFGWQE
jgi:hypothetical protein